MAPLAALALCFILPLYLSAAVNAARPAASSPLVNATDCLMRSFALERALAVNPNLSSAQLSAMADALSGDQ